MAKSIYREKALQPDDGMIALAVKEAKALWDHLIQHALTAYPDTIREWKYYGAAWGWCLTLTHKKKNLAYLTPSDGAFWCSLNFNEKGRELARQAGFSNGVMETIESGKTNTAGHTFDIEVGNTRAAELVKRLLAIKAAC